jgi:hypothetical protein
VATSGSRRRKAKALRSLRPVAAKRKKAGSSVSQRRCSVAVAHSSPSLGKSSRDLPQSLSPLAADQAERPCAAARRHVLALHMSTPLHSPPAFLSPFTIPKAPKLIRLYPRWTVSRWDRLLIFAGCNVGAAACFVICFALFPVVATRPTKFVLL